MYASGRPLSPEELAKAAGIASKRKAVRLVKGVAKRIRESLKAIEVVELPNGTFAMQLRPELYTIAKKFAQRKLVSNSVLKTLSHIVYFQPISSAQLASRLGSRVYSHLKELEALRFVTAEPQGRVKVYRTTPVFAQYFGLDPDPEALKKQLSRLGLRPLAKVRL